MYSRIILLTTLAVITCTGATIGTSVQCSSSLGSVTSSESDCSSETVKPESQPWETYSAASSRASAVVTSSFGFNTVDMQTDLSASAVLGSWPTEGGDFITANAASHAAASLALSGITDGPERDGTFFFVYSSAGSIPIGAERGGIDSAVYHTFSTLALIGIAPPGSTYNCSSDGGHGCLTLGTGLMRLGQPFFIGLESFGDMNTALDVEGYAFHSTNLHLEFRELDGSPVGWHETVSVAEPGTLGLILFSGALLSLRRRRRNLRSPATCPQHR